MKLTRRLRLLPVLILICFLCFTVRIGEFWSSLSRMGEAGAQEKVSAEPPPMPVEAKKAIPVQAGAAEGSKAGETHADAAPVKQDGGKDHHDAPKEPQLPTLGGAEKAQWRDSTEDDVTCSKSEENLFKDMVKRRNDLDKETKEQATRKALLDAAQRELDQKVAEMTSLRNQIQGMMNTLSDQEKARIESLVKIYEGMKPADAARIFNTLDMDVLIEVMSQMKEAKTAPVLAAMDSERAKAVTVMLAQQKKLPELPPAAP